MSWLITGGAGYIGAHVVRAMTDAGNRVVVLDDLSTGLPARVPAAVPLVVGTVRDVALVERVIDEHHVDGIMHLAAKKRVDESVSDPTYYYRENVEGILGLLEASRRQGIRRWVYSSSSSVYGTPLEEVVTEDTVCRPLNPYGQTKLAGEWLLEATAEAADIDYVALRYFNVVGAACPELGDPGRFTIVPRTLARLGEGLPPLIYGVDYPTPDGTCIRDYVHVGDVAAAHAAAARRLAEGPLRTVLNVGLGRGVSVREMVSALLGAGGAGKVTPEIRCRRPGDPARVVGDALRIRDVLGWWPRYDLDEMVTSAWQAWEHQRQDSGSPGASGIPSGPGRAER
jgi:UDP-glucose 4-epimerase